MKNRTSLTIIFLLSIGVTLLCVVIYKRQGLISKFDPRVRHSQMALVQFSGIKSVQNIEKSLIEMEKLGKSFFDMTGYENAIELVRVHLIKAKWMIHAHHVMNPRTNTDTFRQRIHREIDLAESSLSFFVQQWGTASRGEILKILMLIYSEDSVYTEDPQLIMIVSERADHITEALNHHEALLLEIEDLRDLIG